MAVAVAVTNVAAYGYTIVAARLLGPRQYGGFAAVMGLLLVVGVVQLGLQATGARRVASTPEHVAEIERTVLGLTYRAAAVLGAACLILTPVIQRGLHLDGALTAALVGLTAVPMTVMGGQAGILQGERRWRALAAVYLASGVPRVVLGSALLWWRPTEAVAVLGVALTFCAPVIVGWFALGRSAARRDPTSYGGHGYRSVLREIVHNSHALLAFFALSNADVILARNVLDRHDSGLYAGGLILVKAVLFLPQFVVVVAFPSMSTASERQRALARSLGLVLGLGALCVLATVALSWLALIFIGGHQYAAIQSILWRFAVLGTVLSMLQLLVYGVVARQSRLAVYAVWAGLVVLAAGAHFQHSVGAMLTLVTVADTAVLVVLLTLSGLRARDEA